MSKEFYCVEVFTVSCGWEKVSHHDTLKEAKESHAKFCAWFSREDVRIVLVESIDVE